MPFRSDNYYDLREKLQERLDAEEKAHEMRLRPGDPLYENLLEISFHQMDRYLRDRLYPLARERGKMTDMSRPLRDYYLAVQRARRGERSSSGGALVCSSPGLGNWTSLGPSTYAAPIMGKVTSVWADSASPGTAYAGAAHGGLFKTVNFGASWTNLTDAGRYPSLGITSIAVHPTVPTTIYIATNNWSPGGGGPYGFGILKSTDGGTTWQEIFTLATYDNQANYNVGAGSFVSKIMLHPQDPNYIYALASHYAFRSADGGATWGKVMEIVPPAVNPDGCGYRLIDIDIINGTSGVADSTIIVSTVRTAWLGLAISPCGTAKSFMSTAGGANGTFMDITSAVLGGDFTDRIATALQPGNQADVFVAYQSLTTTGGYLVVKKYNIASGTTTPVGTVTTNAVFQLGAGFWNLEFEFSRLDPNTAYLSGTTVYRMSLAGGFSTAQISSYWATDPFTLAPVAKTHADDRTMMVVTIGPNDRLVIGTDGGIHQAVLNPAIAYTPTTANWRDLTGPGLAINEFYDVHGMQSNPEVFVGGTQDNGTFEYNNGVWTQRKNYDGWLGTINQATGEYFGMSNAGAMKGMTGTTGPFVSVGAPPIGSGPVVSDWNAPAVIYVGAGTSLRRSPDFGSTWAALPSPPGSTNIHSIHVAPSNSNRIYVSREGPTWTPANLADRLFKSSDGGNTWADIGVNLMPLPGQPLAWTSVLDIAVDPDNEDRLWIALNGYWPTSNTSTDGVNRVLHSGDGGNTWSDYTYNLPAFPVASLIYRRGSQDELYAGTDVAVYRYNKSLQTWECFDNQLPVVPVTRMEINYCKDTMVAATWGRGVYKTGLPKLAAKAINTSVTWAGVRYLSGDLTIAPGATLTLTGTLYMSTDTRIIVQRGAVLDVNGGRITNACGDMWFGIEVWGTKSAPQNLAGAQGKVVLRNFATIENAREAITTGKDVNTAFDWGFTGAIVQIQDSYFYNNSRSVQFMYYHWMSGSGQELNNLSYIRRSTFETNRRLSDPTVTPYAHVSLYEVTNVRIFGCTFTNTAPTTVFGANARGDGVVSADAQYTVDDLLNTNISPATLIAPSVFSGLTYGIRAGFTAGMTKKVTIQNSDFNNVQRGVQVDHSIKSSVNANNFNALPNAATTNFSDATWAVRMNNASDLSVRGNAVTGASSAYQNNYGVIIDGSGSSAGNVVFGNTLKNLGTGILAQGPNGAGATGVQFRCNVFQPAMAYQLTVAAPTGTLADQGTMCAQGSTADNTFFAQTLPMGSQINSPGATFTYYASGVVPTNTAGGVIVNNCGIVSDDCTANP